MLKRFLMSTAAFAPPGEGGGGEGEPLETEIEAGGEEGEGADSAGEDEGEGLEATGEGADGEEGAEGEVDPQPEQLRKGRAGETIRQLRARVQQSEADRVRIDRELADLRAEQRQRQQAAQQETPEAKATRRALMDPMDVMREDLRESEQRTQNLLHQQALQTQETNDRTLYNGILRDAPHLKRYDAEVEKIRLEQQAKGLFVPREVLLDLAIGRAARAAAAKTAPRARARAAAGVAAQQSRPAAARGDTATQRGRQGDSAEKRLENVPI